MWIKCDAYQTKAGGGRHIVAIVTIDVCPVQIEGLIVAPGLEYTPFYFRARGREWRFGTGDRPVAVTCEKELGFLRKGQYNKPKASWMPVDEALAIIQQCAEEFLEDEPKDD